MKGDGQELIIGEQRAERQSGRGWGLLYGEQRAERQRVGSCGGLKSRGLNFLINEHLRADGPLVAVRWLVLHCKRYKCYKYENCQIL